MENPPFPAPRSANWEFSGALFEPGSGFPTRPGSRRRLGALSTEITLQPGDSAEEFSLLGGEEENIWLLLGFGVGAVGGLTFCFFCFVLFCWGPTFFRIFYRQYI